MKNIFLNEQKVGMLLQKRRDTRGVGISSMRKSIYILTTTPSSHTHGFHPLPLATPTSCSPHPLASPIHSTHSPQLSSILLTCAKFKVWLTIVESGLNVWVWIVGVVSRTWVWLLGVVVRRYIDFLILLIPTPLVSLLFCSSIPTFCSFFKCFSLFHLIAFIVRSHKIY